VEIISTALFYYRIVKNLLQGLNKVNQLYLPTFSPYFWIDQASVPVLSPAKENIRFPFIHTK
jgi:hypothetical protein